jgi:ACS family hexuronate transporter-like MFS transporter
MDGAPERSPNFRWTVCALLFFATTINYIDRQVISLLKPTLASDLHIDDIGYAQVVMWFQATYAASYMVGGRLIDVLRVRLGYSLAVASWSFAAIGTAFATSLGGFELARGVLGAAEGANFPAAIRAVADWFPQKERALATGLFNSGSNLGVVFSSLLVPFLVIRFGWQAAFVVTGLLGFIWLAVWIPLYRNPVQAAESGAAAPWLPLLRLKSTWAYILGTAWTSPIWWFYLFWIPDFLFKQYGIDLKTVGVPLVTVYVMAGFGGLGGGWLSSSLIHRGSEPLRARKIALLVCACCVIPVLFVTQTHSLWTATIIVGLAAAAHQGFSANLYTLASDMNPKEAVASVVGLGGAAGGVVSIFFAGFVGVVLERTHSYVFPFAFSPCAYFLGLACIAALARPSAPTATRA